MKNREWEVLQQLEDLFDRRKPPHAELDQAWSLGADLLRALYIEEWAEVRRISREIFDRAQTPAMKAFALQWGVAATETVFDPAERARWIALWDQVEGWATDPFARYLRTFHEALTRFFDASLRDAEDRFTRALGFARDLQYPRGQQRCLQHLALVYRDQGHAEAAIGAFEQALAIARGRRATIPVGRILAQLERLQPGRTAAPSEMTALTRIEWLQARIDRALGAGELHEARQLLAQADEARRDAGYGRRRCTLSVYLAAIHWSRGRAMSGARVWNRIKDPLLRIQALELKERIPGLGLRDGERAELQALRFLHGVSPVVLRAGSDPAALEICGVRLSTVREVDVHKLMTSLIGAREALDKAALCERVWGLRYDPVTHDGRIYKLIHRARKAFGREDLILNTYGAYRLNPEYYDASWLASIRAS